MDGYRVKITKYVYVKTAQEAYELALTARGDGCASEIITEDEYTQTGRTRKMQDLLEFRRDNDLVGT